MLTIKDIRSEYIKIYPHSKFSLSTLTHWLLKNLGYKYKHINLINFRRSLLNYKIMVYAYAERLSAILEEKALILSLDEASFGENRRRIKSWVSKEYSGSRNNAGRIQNISIMAVIDRMNIVKYSINEGTNK